jgi:glycosyltransferase involved in cell wall biosynthesis
MWEEARALSKRGHDVSVFTTDTLGQGERIRRPSPNVEDGIHVHRFRNISNGLAYHQYRFTPVGLTRALKTQPADVLHLSEVRHELAICAWRAARRRDIPLLVSAHGTLPRRTGPKATLRRIYDRLFVSAMLNGAAAALAQTANEVSGYIEFGVDPERVHLLPLGTETAPPAAGLPPFDVPAGARVVLFLGRIHPLKGVPRLIRSVAAVAQNHDDLHLVIAGRDDGDLAHCQAVVEELGLTGRVTFPGPIYGDRRYDAYRQADLFAITPTHFEETSLASLEAASVGTALLVSEEADAPFLREYDAGFTVPAGVDPTEHLRLAVSSDLAATGARAKRMIEERHTWAVVGERLSDIIGQVAR